MRINKTEEIESNPMKSVEVNSIYIIFVFINPFAKLFYSMFF